MTYIQPSACWSAWQFANGAAEDISWEYAPQIFAKEFYFPAGDWLEYNPAPQACRGFKYSALNVNKPARLDTKYATVGKPTRYLNKS